MDETRIIPIIDSQIAELRRERSRIAKTSGRKQYFSEYYQRNRLRILAKAKERYDRNKIRAAGADPNSAHQK